jgi:glycyl-tRNA synthetase beta chain
MPELLLELFSEEIPARMQARAAEDLSKALASALAPVLQAAPRSFHGPRRIGLVADLAASVTLPGREERGPRIGAPAAALEGFLRKHGATREMLVEEAGFLVLRKPDETLAAAELVARSLPPCLRAFPWPKSMRWNGPFTWVRPLQRILCLLDGAVVPFAIPDSDLASADRSEGHRILSPGAFLVRDFAQFEAELRARHVVLDAGERARLIEEGLASLAAAEGLRVVPDRGLLEEVAGLVEWPVPFLGRIDSGFMDLPPELMRTTMRVNQRYFALVDAAGNSAPRFGLIANIVPNDGGAALVAGNERVLRARLSDARFFWDQDRKQRLEDFLPKLDSVVFHAKLGTQGQRVARLESLARFLAPIVGADADLAARAARLAKADLSSGLVGEFPELQGIIGRYYALHWGEEARVAEAIGAHYRPLGATDAVPAEPIAMAVALADKLDQLAGFFAAGEKPSGSGDPFALRRAALGILRIIREGRLRLPLAPAIAAASSGHGQPVPADLLDFLLERLRVQLRAEGARHDLVTASIGQNDDILRILARAKALETLVDSDSGRNLLAAYKRAQNILRIEEKKDGPHSGPVDVALLTLPEEASLMAALNAAEAATQAAAAGEDYDGAMAALAALRDPLDAFFASVIVNDSDAACRRNRLRLLARLRGAMDGVAEFSKIEA